MLDNRAPFVGKAGARPTPDAMRQHEAISILSDPKVHGGEEPERIDTHLSHVFLGPKYALKLKRAVALDFVDYSTRESRRAYCAREIAANQVWASSLYKGIDAVWRSETASGVGEPPEDAMILDWVVRMARFSRDQEADQLLLRDALDGELIDRFADRLSAIHAATAPARCDSGALKVEGLIDQLVHDLGAAAERAQIATPLSAWEPWAREELAANITLLQKRTDAHCIKPCHGDLHLKNIVLHEGALIGFDALEFDDDLTEIDTLYDAVFPVMDLLRFNKPVLANRLLSRYLARSDDYAGLPLLGLFLSIRALIRAMAACLRGDKSDARCYLDLVENLMEATPKPALLAVGGRSASGKTTVSREATATLPGRVGAVHLRSDLLRKTLAGKEPEQAMPAEAYSERQRETIYTECLARAQTVIEAGYSCLVDATFLSVTAREEVAGLAKRMDVPFLPLWLEAPAERLRERIKARGPDASDANLSVLEKQLKEPSPEDWDHVDVSGTMEVSLHNLKAAIQSRL